MVLWGAWLISRFATRKEDGGSMARSPVASQLDTSIQWDRKKVRLPDLCIDLSGWAPQQFKSSRSKRDNRVQRAEDFMDEEDLAQMNEDRQLENTETFRADQFAGTRETIGDKRYESDASSLTAVFPALWNHLLSLPKPP